MAVRSIEILEHILITKFKRSTSIHASTRYFAWFEIPGFLLFVVIFGYLTYFGRQTVHDQRKGNEFYETYAPFLLMFVFMILDGTETKIDTRYISVLNRDEFIAAIRHFWGDDAYLDGYQNDRGDQSDAID